MIEGKDILLRDFREEDIAKRIHWETEENEWQLWDGPWEYEGLTEAEKAAQLEGYVEALHKRAGRCQAMPPEETRWSFEIETKDGDYIGWVSAYNIDDDYSYTTGHGHCAVGIDIPEGAARGKGYAYQALGLFLHYLLNHGVEALYLQTWSGNERMIHIAEKMGFEECRRKVGYRSVRGKVYDGLTFRLNPQKLRDFEATLPR